MPYKHVEAIQRESPALDKGVHPMLTMVSGTQISEEEVHHSNDMTGDCVKLKNSTVLAQLEAKMQHLSASRQAQLSSLLSEFVDVFPEVPTQTTVTLQSWRGSSH